MRIFLTVLIHFFLFKLSVSSSIFTVTVTCSISAESYSLQNTTRVSQVKRNSHLCTSGPVIRLHWQPLAKIFRTSRTSVGLTLNLPMPVPRVLRVTFFSRAAPFVIFKRFPDNGLQTFCFTHSWETHPFSWASLHRGQRINSDPVTWIFQQISNLERQRFSVGNSWERAVVWGIWLLDKNSCQCV